MINSSDVFIIKGLTVWYDRIYSLKCLTSTKFDCKDIGIRKFEFVTQNLSQVYTLHNKDSKFEKFRFVTKASFELRQFAFILLSYSGRRLYEYDKDDLRFQFWFLSSC